jgi:hypothetical protein
MLQTNFGAGELAPAIALRRDTQQYRDGAKSMLNSRILIGGGARRRPGTWRLRKSPDKPVLAEFTVSASVKYLLEFTIGRMDAFLVDVNTGAITAAGSVTGAPWTSITLIEADFFASGNTIIVTHPEFLKYIQRTGPSSWSMTDFPFHTASTGRIHQPHFKVAAPGVTLTPSAEIGTVTLVASDAVFVPGDIGKRIRLADREVEVTGYTDAFTIAVNVLERLRPTQRLVVASTNTLKLDDVVQGVTTGARGIVVALGGTQSVANGLTITTPGTLYTVADTLTVVGGSGTAATITVQTVDGGGGILTALIATGGSYSTPPNNPVSVTGGTGDGLATFTLTFATSTDTINVVIIDKLTKFDNEDIVGPDGKVACTAAQTITPGPVKDWTEQLYSAALGYPRAGTIHRGRILLAGSPAAPNAIAGTSIANVFSFDIGTGGDADGFLETIGDAASVSIQQLHSDEQLVVFTDRGPYYVPESPSNPFRPTSLAFNHFGGTWQTSTPRVGAFDSGVVFVSKSTIVKATKTGNTSAFWDALEKSFLCPHLIKKPVSAAYCLNYANGPERYGFFANTDGTAAVMQLVDSENVRNFVPWETSGNYVSFCVIGEFVYAAVQRVINGVAEYWIELFDDDLTLDGVTEYATQGAMDAAKASIYGNSTAHVCTEDMHYLGAWPVSNPPTGPYHLGFFYDREIETLPPNIEQGGKYAEVMRILSADVGVLESAHFEANGTELHAYLTEEDPSAPPPLRTQPRHFDFLASGEREPTIRIVQPHALPLTILGIKTKVVV